MIPLRLTIAGFLSYREPVDLDFTRFSLACISGPNGAGKSTLLDAITWVLFGQARRRDDSLINLQSRAAEVVLAFRYENTEYRVQRTLTRGKGQTLELQVRQSVPDPRDSAPRTEEQRVASDSWKPLTERTVRETQSRIEQILRLDYETFVNASFFLQGKADQFAQQSPAKRKDVLGNILGLETWAVFKSRTGDLRRDLEAQLARNEGRLGEIRTELEEEMPRRKLLEGLEIELSRVVAARTAQAAALENLRQTHASLDKQRLLIESMEAGLSQSQEYLSDVQGRLLDRRATRAESAELLLRADQINAAYAQWQTCARELARWDQAALKFRDREGQRAPLITQIASEQARLEEEGRHLMLRAGNAAATAESRLALQSDIEHARSLLANAEAQVARQTQTQAELSSARQSLASVSAANETLRVEMDQLAGRIETLESASGAACPLCGQPLSAQHRDSTLQVLRSEGKQRGDRYRHNKAAAEDHQAAILILEANLREIAGADEGRSSRAQSVAQLAERMAAVESLLSDWESVGQPRLTVVQKQLEREDYASEPRQVLAKLDQELAELGYDAVAHDRTRLLEQRLSGADGEYRRLESARAVLVPLDKEITGLEAETAQRTGAIERQAAELAALQGSFSEAQHGLPDLAGGEGLLFEIQEQENRLNQQVGAARQRVSVLADLRLRAAEFESTRQDLAMAIGRYKILERSFGQEGVPALLIEQALPEVETRANEILDRLSDGQMSVRFMTQTEYKDKKREDLRETLEIQISDGAGPRDYETYSGGEAFRVNFAVRLALSQVLAARKGARLQTLVIDEGFGSQDSQGRQRLIEAINLVKEDFEKILLITHLEELKDAFPARIEVEKTERGSVLRIT